MIRDIYKQRGHDAFHHQRSLQEEMLVQQRPDAHRNLRVEAPIHAAQSPTQCTAQFTMMEFDTSAAKNELHRLQMQALGTKSEDMKTFWVPWLILGEPVAESESRSPQHQIPFMRRSNLKGID